MCKMVLSAKETGHEPVYQVGAYLYEISGVSIDVREVAEFVPGFEAGETVQEHRSLLLMAFLQMRELQVLLLGGSEEFSGT